MPKIKYCLVCKGLMSVKPSHYDRTFYCSRICQRKDYARRFSGENNSFYGKKHSEETKKKLSECHKKIGAPWNKGRKLSEERKEQLRQSSLRNPARYWLGKKFSEEHKRKLALVWKGRKHSEESKQKMSLVTRGKPHITQKGEGNHAWQGGTSFEPYSVDWTETLKRAIRERDHYLCGICKLYGEYVHHIDYDKKNCNPNNLITLCNSCHGKTNHNRERWKNYFNGK